MSYRMAASGDKGWVLGAGAFGPAQARLCTGSHHAGRGGD